MYMYICLFTSYFYLYVFSFRLLSNRSVTGPLSGDPVNLRKEPPIYQISDTKHQVNSAIN